MSSIHSIKTSWRIVKLLSIPLLYLLLVFYVLDNVINIATQRFAELVNSFRTDRFIVPQTVDCAAAYVMFVN